MQRSNSRKQQIYVRQLWCKALWWPSPSLRHTGKAHTHPHTSNALCECQYIKRPYCPPHNSILPGQDVNDTTEWRPFYLLVHSISSRGFYYRWKLFWDIWCCASLGAFGWMFIGINPDPLSGYLYIRGRQKQNRMAVNNEPILQQSSSAVTGFPMFLSSINISDLTHWQKSKEQHASCAFQLWRFYGTVHLAVHALNATQSWRKSAFSIRSGKGSLVTWRIIVDVMQFVAGGAGSSALQEELIGLAKETVTNDWFQRGYKREEWYL